jgi:sirohydrochlorin cobaltochelatase
MDQGLVLFAHGARDPRWAEPFERLAVRIGELARDTRIALAYLETMQPDLAAACANLIALGCEELVIVPIFLGQGGHVRLDLPEQIKAVRCAHPGISIRASAAAGEDATVIDAIAKFSLAQLSQVNPEEP